MLNARGKLLFLNLFEGCAVFADFNPYYFIDRLCTCSSDYISKQIRGRYSCWYDGDPNEYEAILEGVFSEGACQAFFRANPSVPALPRDYYLSKLFQLMVISLDMPSWELRELLAERLDQIPSAALTHLNRDFDLWQFQEDIDAPEGLSEEALKAVLHKVPSAYLPKSTKKAGRKKARVRPEVLERGLAASSARVEDQKKLGTELTAIWQEVQKPTELETLRARFPEFECWKLLQAPEQEELLEGTFKPRKKAQELVLRKHSLTSPDSLKLARRRVRGAQ